MLPPFHFPAAERKRRREMDRVHTSRRGPEWKQGWTGQTLSSISAPPLPLVAVFAIVVFLLSLSHYATYKELLENTMFSFKIVLFLAPVILILLLRSTQPSSRGWPSFWSSSQRRQEPGAGGAAAFPWGVAIVLVALLVLLSYQSSFNSKWFPFGTSD